MMKRMQVILFTLALVVIFLVIEIIIVKNVSRYEPETEIVYAKVKIPENTVVQPDMLALKRVGVSMVHSQGIAKADDAIGKRAVTDIVEGEMVLSSRLAAENEMEKIKVKNLDSRLFTVEFKGDQANGWWLAADQYVDIIFVPNENIRTQSAAGTQRLRNIRIAAVIDDRGKLVKKREGASLPRYISFEVTDRQDEFLASAKGLGRLELSVIPDSP